MESSQALNGMSHNGCVWQSVPQDLLEKKIFLLLFPLQLFTCRRVCRSWKASVFKMQGTHLMKLVLSTLNTEGEVKESVLMTKLNELVLNARKQIVETVPQRQTETDVKQKGSISRYDSAHENLPEDMTPTLMNNIFWPRFQACQILAALEEKPLGEVENFALLLIKYESHAKELVDFFNGNDLLVKNLQPILQNVKSHANKDESYQLIFGYLDLMQLQIVEAIVKDVADEKASILLYLFQRYVNLGVRENAVKIYRDLGENHPFRAIMQTYPGFLQI